MERPGAGPTYLIVRWTRQVVTWPVRAILHGFTEAALEVAMQDLAQRHVNIQSFYAVVTLAEVSQEQEGDVPEMRRLRQEGASDAAKGSLRILFCVFTPALCKAT